LLLFDLGFTNFTFFRQLGEQGVFFITRAKSNLAFRVERVLRKTAAVHDQLVWIGKNEDRQLVRLVAVLYQGKWYRSLTNDLDPAHVPVEYAVALYWQRWRIEMVYRSLPFFTRARHRGDANDLLLYLADNALELGILKPIGSNKPSRFRSLQLTIAQRP
jgi:hypothetical protein